MPLWSPWSKAASVRGLALYLRRVIPLSILWASVFFNQCIGGWVDGLRGTFSKMTLLEFNYRLGLGAGVEGGR